jgi:hypothetical protein
MKYFLITKYGRTSIHKGELERQGEMLWLTTPGGKRLWTFHESELGNSVKEISREEFESLQAQDNRLAEMKSTPRSMLEHGMTEAEWRMRHGWKDVGDQY